MFSNRLNRLKQLAEPGLNRIGDEVLKAGSARSLTGWLSDASKDGAVVRCLGSTPLPAAPPPRPPTLLRQAGDHLLLDVAPQFWTSPDVNSTFSNITKGGQVGDSRRMV